MKELITLIPLDTVVTFTIVTLVAKYALMPKLDVILDKVKEIYTSVAAKVTEFDELLKEVDSELSVMFEDGKLTADEVAKIKASLPALKEALERVISKEQ